MSAPLPAPAVSVPLSGWGNHLHVPCRVSHPEAADEVARHIDRTGTLSRGLGRSYGDVALLRDGRVVGMARVDRYLAFDEATGVLTAEAGVSLAQVLRDFAPRGWLPWITPGTKYVTLGGCVSNDVHGKAHHAQGSFSASVLGLTVLLASGEVVVCSRTERPDLFWGVVAGVGLLGIVLTVTVRLRRVETTWFRQRSVVAGDLEALLAAIEEGDAAFPYSVATLDPTATGARLGRGVLALGDHATLDELPAALRPRAREVSGPPKLVVPRVLPQWVLNPLTAGAVNVAARWMQAHTTGFGHYEGFFYPLDFVHQWNLGYGPRGFTQYQFVIPLDRGAAVLRTILETIVASGQLPFLNILKRLGPEDDGLLSFAREGWTFAIDFPLRPETPGLLTRLDALVLDAGGRVYLGKDAFLGADAFRAMYPRHAEFLALKARVDPDGVFRSELGRRVGLTGAPAVVAR